MNLTPIQVDEKTAAALLSLSPNTLRQWRHEGKGPAFTRDGRTVRYLVADLTAYAESRRVNAS